VGRRRNWVTGFVGGEGVVDAGEGDVWIFVRELRDVVGEDEPDADHEIHVLRGQQTEPGFAIGAFSRLDQPDA
jgi:hypothetical protein